MVKTTRERIEVTVKNKWPGTVYNTTVWCQSLLMEQSSSSKNLPSYVNNSTLTKVNIVVGDIYTPQTYRLVLNELLCWFKGRLIFSNDMLGFRFLCLE